MKGGILAQFVVIYEASNLSKDRLTCRQRGRLCVLARWSPHRLAWHPPMSHSAARCQMHLGYGSDDCSIAGCNVVSPWLLSTLEQHKYTHLSLLHLEFSVSCQTCSVHFSVLFDNVKRWTINLGIRCRCGDKLKLSVFAGQEAG